MAKGEVGVADARPSGQHHSEMVCEGVGIRVVNGEEVEQSDPDAPLAYHAARDGGNVRVGRGYVLLGGE